MCQRVLIVVFLFFMSISASVPREIVYQGLLTDQNKTPLADGDYQITFSLYDAESATTALWTEDQTLKTKQGVFSASIGSTKTGGINLTFDKQYWLGVKTGNKELLPRVKVGSSAYALRSAVADSVISVDGALIKAVSIDSSKIKAGGISGSTIAVNAIDSSKIKNGGISTGDVAASFKAPFAGVADSARNASYATSAGSVSAGSHAHSTLTKKGNITDTVLFVDTIGNVGIGINNPYSKMHVNGTLTWGGDTSSQFSYSGNDALGLFIEQVNKTNMDKGKIRLQSRKADTGSYSTFSVDGDNKRFVFEGGNVGINRAEPNAQLQIGNNLALGLSSKPNIFLGSNIAYNDSTKPGYAYFGISGGLADSIPLYGIGGYHWGAITSCDVDTKRLFYFGYFPEDILTNPFVAEAAINGRNGDAWFKGNVGIGNSSPGYKLDVNGELRINGGMHNTTGNYWFLNGADGAANGAIGGLSISPDYNYGAPVNGLYVYGNVGIGIIDPGIYKLNVAGDIHSSGTISASEQSLFSDIRLKTNIDTISNALQKVESLRGVTYNWNIDKFPERNFLEGKQIGLIAQDVEKVLPELVHTDTDGYKSLSYDKLTAVLIEAVKQQQKIIDSQNAKIDALQAEVLEIKESIEK